jgi:hypothetical protein
VEGSSYPLILASTAVLGVVLGALYMLWFAQRFLFGAAKAPHMPLSDLDLREKSILVAVVVAVFAFGLFPDEPLGKTELAARQYQQLRCRTDRTRRIAPPLGRRGPARRRRSRRCAEQRAIGRPEARDELANDLRLRCFRSTCCSRDLRPRRARDRTGGRARFAFPYRSCVPRGCRRLWLFCVGYARNRSRASTRSIRSLRSARRSCSCSRCSFS